MKNVLIVLFLFVVVANGEFRWTQRARVRDHTEFITEVIQETIYKIERRGFSSLRLLNITDTVNLQMYKWLVNGTVTYSNGFLVSIQKLDVTGMQQIIGIANNNGVQTPWASVRGTLNMRDVKLGYDVTFVESNGTVHKFTGDFTHILITWLINIEINLLTKDIIVYLTSGTSGGLIRMVYRPANNLTEVLSRGFFPYQNANGVAAWANTLRPIILDVIKNKVPFPDVCFTQC